MAQHIFEPLPAQSVDLNHAFVSTLSYETEEMPEYTRIDDVIDAGVINLVDTNLGVETKLHWGKTAPDANGQYAVIVDAPEIKLEHLQVLWLAKVIDGDMPTVIRILYKSTQ
jgi:hypothetical protein